MGASHMPAFFHRLLDGLVNANAWALKINAVRKLLLPPRSHPMLNSTRTQTHITHAKRRPHFVHFIRHASLCECGIESLYFVPRPFRFRLMSCAVSFSFFLPLIMRARGLSSLSRNIESVPHALAFCSSST